MSCSLVRQLHVLHFQVLHVQRPLYVMQHDTLMSFREVKISKVNLKRYRYRRMTVGKPNLEIIVKAAYRVGHRDRGYSCYRSYGCATMLCGTSYLLYMHVSTIFRYTCDGLQTQNTHIHTHTRWHKVSIFYKKKLTAQDRCDVVVLCGVVTPQHNRSKILLLLLLCHVLWQKVATFYKKLPEYFCCFGNFL